MTALEQPHSFETVPIVNAPKWLGLLGHWLGARPLVVGFALALLALVIGRGYILATFSFRWTDQDQTAMWYTAADAARGHFHEPCFPGQRYNVPVEAWLAAPLIKLGMPAPYALPLSTATLALAPFICLALACMANRRPWAGCLVLLVPLAMPVQYQLVTGMTRGFVQGLALATPAVIIWLFAKRWIWFPVAAAAAVLAVTANPNAAPVLAAAGIYGWLQNFRRPAFYGATVFGTALAAAVPYYVYSFYDWYPQYVIYEPKPGFVFVWSNFTHAFTPEKLNVFFAYLVPVFGKGEGIAWIFAVLLLLLVLVWNWRGLLGLLCGVAMILIGLSIGRVQSSSPDVFLSGSRMFLAVPVLWALALVWLDERLTKRSQGSAAPLGFRLAGLIVLAALATSQDWGLTLDPTRFLPRGGPIEVTSVASLRAQSSEIASAAHEVNAGFVLVLSGDHVHVQVYALPALTNFRVETLYPALDRRAWRPAEENQMHRDRILIWGNVQNIPQVGSVTHALQRVSQDPSLLCLRVPPDETVTECLQHMGFKLGHRFN